MTSHARDTGWFKSSFSGSADEACVEVRLTEVLVGVRDSKNVAGPELAVSPGAWAGFVAVAAR